MFHVIFKNLKFQTHCHPHPISLITRLYKILTKVLAGHIWRVLNETIYKSLGFFIEQREILDAVLVSNEVVDEKRYSGEERVVFKIDFDKAYYHVDWGFFGNVLERII